MKEKFRKQQKLTVVFTILAVAAWVITPLISHFSVQASDTAADCPNGPLKADLKGAAAGGKAPQGLAQYKDRNSNSLMVMVRSVSVPEGTALNVFVGDTNVGQITVPKNGNGQLKVDSPTAAIAEGTEITVRNGETTIMSGTFACAAKGGSTTPSPTATTTPSPTASPTASPTVTPTVTPTATPTLIPTPTIEK